MEITRLATPSAQLIALVEEYYETVQVMVRDTPESLAQYCGDPRSGVWIASEHGEPLGCVVLRPLPRVEGASECKRLYVKPGARGRGVADALMQALEQHARSLGYRAVYLDTHEGLQPAIALYRKRGYVICGRYNNNPQATVFLRKTLVLGETTI